MAIATSGTRVVTFPQEPYNNYYNNNYPVDGISPKQDNNARAQDPGWLAIEGAYYATFGRAIAPVVRAQMLSMVEQGAALDLIAAVIEYSASAPRPSWAYARTVLRRQMDMGTRTAAEFTAACSEYRRKAAERAARPDCWSADQGYYSSRAPRKLREQCYDQRDYGPELAGMSAADIAEAKRLFPSPPKRVIEQCYSQREYDPAKVDGPTPDEIAAARML